MSDGKYKPKVSLGKVSKYRSKATINTGCDRICATMFMTQNDWDVLQRLVEQVKTLDE